MWLALAIPGYGRTLVVPGNVSGTWTQAGSPYVIQTGSITVPNGSSLVVEAGVIVEFSGHHKFTVNGHLLALGTETDSIVFRAERGNVAGWKGLRLIGADSTQFRYCRIEDGVARLTSSSDSTGGGVFLGSASVVTFEHCLFENNRATLNGGALFVTGGTGAICTDCRFFRNQADKDGGAAFVNGSTLSRFERCEFERNTSGKEAGAIHSRGGAPTYIDCEFRDNSCFNSGGAVMASGQASFRRCVFEGNTSIASQGGGLYFYDSLAAVTLDSCRIAHNVTLLRDGGGAYCWEAAPRFTDCQFVGNRSADDGGGIHCYRNGSNATFTRCLFENNFAADRGGGVKISRFSRATLTDCVIRGNSTGGSGGGVFCRLQCEPVFTRCLIENNQSAGSGGGVGAIESNPRFVDCTIAGNTTDSLGGGISAYSCDVDMSNCRISDNHAELFGGGISLRLSSPDVERCRVERNLADSLGGGLYLFEGLPHILNCLITDNQSRSRGGALYVGDATPLVEHCTIVDNYAGAGHVLYAENSQGTLLNSIVANADFETGNGGAPTGSGLVATPLPWILRNSLFYQPGLPEYAGVIADGFGQLTSTNANGQTCDGYGNVFGEPGFVGTGAEPYALRTDGGASPAVNAGALTAAVSDLPGSSRPEPSGSLPDMGCVEAMQNGQGSGLWGSQSGVLASGSYRVFGNLIVPFGSRWEISAGTELRFMGPYGILVYGELFVAGNPLQPVTLHSEDEEDRLHWRGVRFYGPAASASRVNHAMILNAAVLGTDTSGGAAGFFGGCAPELNSCRFERCSAGGTGGALRVAAGAPTLNNCEFFDCSASVGGAARVEPGQQLTLRECSLINCSANLGGALSVEGGTLTLLGIYAVGNSATAGGAVHARNSQITITDCRMQENTAVEEGGALLVLNSTVTAALGNLSYNSAQSGGAIFAQSSSGALGEIEMRSNFGSVNGGAIFIERGGLEFNRVVLHGNQAGVGGGAAILTNDSSRFERCTLVQNDAPYGAAFYVGDSRAAVNSSQITHNGTAFYFRNSGTADVSYCNLFGNDTRDFEYANGDRNQGPTGLNVVDSTNHLDEAVDHRLNLYRDPLYADLGGENFHLSENSPCLDAADPMLACDPDLSLAEIGAFHTAHGQNLWQPLDLAVCVHDSGGMALTWSHGGDLARLCQTDGLSFVVEREISADVWQTVLTTTDTMCVVPDGTAFEQVLRLRVRSAMP